MNDIAKIYIGRLLVLGSSFFFYFSTVSIRWAAKEVSLHPAIFVFSRFLLGTIIFSIIFIIKNKPLKINHKGYLFGRAIFNTIAVLLFFKAVSVTGSAEANILNMTYPIFIGIISWFIYKKERNFKIYGIIVLSFIGIILTLNPSSLKASIDSLWGLGSGVFAAVAIIFLNLSRQHDETNTILFFVFAFGSIFIAILFFPIFHIPNYTELYFLSLCAVSGILGQYLITLGFRYVNAIEGGIISSMRIFLAAFLGPLIAFDPFPGIIGIIGAILIFISNVIIISEKKSK